jgi:hypothetical protein
VSTVEPPKQFPMGWIIAPTLQVKQRNRIPTGHFAIVRSKTMNFILCKQIKIRAFAVALSKSEIEFKDPSPNPQGLY